MWVFPLPFGARLVVEIESQQALALIEIRRKGLKNVRPVLEAAAGILRESLGRQFAEGGNPAWIPLAPSTIAAKQAQGLPPLSKKGRPLRRLLQRGMSGASSILIASGALRDSYRQKGALGHIEIYTEDSVSVGSNLPYARAHQKGTPAHIIRARFAKALAFPGSSGATILRKSVQHPGLPKRPVGAQAEDRKAIAGLFRNWLRGQHLNAAA